MDKPLYRRLAPFCNLHVMLIIVFIVSFALQTVGMISDPDTPWHLATGQYILQHHRIPTTDPFSWSMKGQPWVTQEWLFEVILALAAKFQYAGVWGLLVLVNLALQITMYRLSLYLTMGNRVVSALVAGSAALLALPFWVVRPQIFSYLFFTILLLLFVRVEQGHRRAALWFLPLALVWANSHSTITLAFAMVVFEIVLSVIPSFGRFTSIRLARGLRLRWLLVLVLGIGAAFLNPNGIHEFTYALFSTNQLMINSINEWHSPSFHADYYKQCLLPVLIVLVLVIAGVKRNISLRFTLYVLGTLGMTLMYQRFAPYFVISASVLLASLIPSWFSTLNRHSVLFTWLSLVASLGMCIALVTQLPTAKGSLDKHWSTADYPVFAVEYMKAHRITGRILNAYDYGGYFIYEHIPTFVDGRTDIFLQHHVFADYMDLQNFASDAPDLLNEYNFQYVVIPTSYSLAAYLNQQSNWKVLYNDGQTEIVERIS